MFELGVLPVGLGAGPGRRSQQLRARQGLVDPALRRLFVEPLPQKLGQKRNKRVQQTQDLINGKGQHLAGRIGLPSLAQAGFDHLHIPVAQLGPEKLADGCNRRRRIIGFELGPDLGRGPRQPRQDPAILKRQV